MGIIDSFCIDENEDFVILYKLYKKNLDKNVYGDDGEQVFVRTNSNQEQPK